MWCALTSWTRLRFVDFLMRDISSFFKWFHELGFLSLSSFFLFFFLITVGGNKLETFMNILLRPVESCSLLCFLRVHYQWLIICVGNLSDSFILLRVKDTWNLELEGCFFSCFSPLQFCCTRMSANCRAIVQLLQNYSLTDIYTYIYTLTDIVNSPVFFGFLFTLSWLRLCYYSDRLLIKASHTVIFIHQAFNTSQRERHSLVLLWYIVTRPLLFTVQLTAVVSFKLVSAPGCCNVVWCTLVFIGYIINKLPLQAARLLLQ